MIGTTLPVRAPLPGEPAATDQPTQVPSTIEDPGEMDRPTEDASSTGESDSAAWVVWAVFGAVVVVAVIGSTLYVRRRTHQEGRSPDA